MKPEEEAAARGVDLGAKAFSSAAPPPRLYGGAVHSHATRFNSTRRSTQEGLTEGFNTNVLFLFYWRGERNGT